MHRSRRSSVVVAALDAGMVTVFADSANLAPGGYMLVIAGGSMRDSDADTYLIDVSR
jgi:hypothetical protein